MRIFLILLLIVGFIGCAVTPDPRETPEPAAAPEPLPDFDTLWDYSNPAKTEQTFRELSRRPLVASAEERNRNPRSRSAKLRVAARTGD